MIWILFNFFDITHNKYQVTNAVKESISMSTETSVTGKKGQY